MAKDFKTLRNQGNISEHVGFGQPTNLPNTDGGIDTGDTAIFNLNDPNVLSKLNAFVGQLSKKCYVNPEFPIQVLQANLHKVGLWFDYRGQFNAVLDNQTLTFPLIRFGGTFSRAQAPEGLAPFEQDSGFGGAAFELVLDISRTESNEYCISASIEPDVLRTDIPEIYEGKSFKNFRKQRLDERFRTTHIDRADVTTYSNYVTVGDDTVISEILNWCKKNNIPVDYYEEEDSQGYAFVIKPKQAAHVKKFMDFINGYVKGEINEAIDYTKEGPWFAAKVIVPWKNRKVGEIVYIRKGGWVTEKSQTSTGDWTDRSPVEDRARLQIWKPPYYANTISATEGKKHFQLIKKVESHLQADMSDRYDWELHR